MKKRRMKNCCVFLYSYLFILRRPSGLLPRFSAGGEAASLNTLIPQGGFAACRPKRLENHIACCKVVCYHCRY
ncbi:MAG: hypothetical protein IKR48_11130 [Kiritimatiellae bacterium]|nr:hypothetical protein [Kiritimatiellia bacterium]